MIPWRLLVPALLSLSSFFSAAMPACAEAAQAALIGRVAAIGGTLALHTGGGVPGADPRAGDWSDSAVNDPLAAGMAVRTDEKSRALLRIGPELVALAPGGEVEFARLDSGAFQLVLRRGRIGLFLSPLEPGAAVEVAEPRGGVWPAVPGAYDIAAGDERNPARVAVLDGKARFAGSGLNRTIGSGEGLSLAGGTAAGASLIAMADSAAADAFDGWWHAAAATDPEAPALRHVSAEMTGYEALDAGGDWQQVAGYGAVWFPKAAGRDWAPYRFGNWRWLAAGGWTWIDDAAWGFAPSHYGRWARLAAGSLPGERWGWVPGGFVAHPVYVPAAVAFLGTAGIGLSCPGAAGAAIAWFPLAPGEAYWPGYPADAGMIGRINQGQVADPGRIGAAGHDGGPPADIFNALYRNRRFATIVPRPVFVAGRPVAGALVQLPERRLVDAPLLAGSPQVAPAPAGAPALLAVAATATPVATAAVQTLARIVRTHMPARWAHPASGRFAQLAMLTRRARAWRQHIVSVALARRPAHHEGHHGWRGWRVASVHRR
jgi:hypothetical protein